MLPSSRRIKALVPLFTVCVLAIGAIGAGGLAAQGTGAIALAVAPLPEESDRAAATVIEVKDNVATVLREGSGSFICITDTPGDRRFHAACYHQSLEPYMARGRELRTEGVDGAENVAQRVEEIQTGTLEMPPYAMLHQIFADADWDGDSETANHIAVIYTPFASASDLGLPTRRVAGPWLMNAGEPNAHIMITP